MKIRIVASGIAGLLALQASWTPAHAIPAFARKHKFSCTTCHEPFPRLKAYGEDFAGDGFMLKEGEKPSDYTKTGDDLLRLNKTFPLAVRFDAFSVIDPDGAVRADLQTPWGVKILSGGALTDKVGYYFYFYMSEKGEVAGVEDAYLHFNDVFGSGVDVMAGQFQTSDPLLKRELRMTFEDYMAYKIRPGMSSINLTYDRGLMFLYGVEKTGTDLTALVVNGSGIHGPKEGSSTVDDDDYKNVGFRLAQDVAGLFSVGGFYYSGKEVWAVEGGPEDRWGRNDVTYFGPDVSFGMGPMDVTAQFLRRTDSNPLFNASPEAETDNLIVECFLMPDRVKSRWAATLLYNRVESDLSGFETYHTATLNGSWLMARNLKLGAEYTRDIENGKNRFVLGVMSGF
ncbi:hypothetical protein JW777_11235 [bacterium]|nr:hypothetical protein [bacterium]